MSQNKRIVFLLFLSVAAIFFLFVASASALALDEAKANGLVGEVSNGYLEAVSPTPRPEVQSLVDDINAKRLAKYQEIAKKRGVPLIVVQELAGKEAIERSPSGHYVRVLPGTWQRK